MSTRQFDLQELEEKRDRGDKAAGRILEKVYRQSKDPETERLRKALIDAVQRNDIATMERINDILRQRG